MLAFLSGLALAADPALSIPFEHYELPNGLDVVLVEDHSVPIVHTQIWYHVGSKDEPAGRTGFAHLFEHLMFQGSANSPGEYFTPLQEVGGNLNGTTNVDRTNYYETVPAEFLPLALFMESDRMGRLLEVLDQGKLDNQRDVVRNERRQRYENPPYGEARSHLMAALYPEGHPYHHPTIGSHTDLEAASLDDVKAFFRTWYVPNNATLVVVGDFDPKVAKKLVKQNFGWIPSGPDPVHAPVEPVTLTEARKLVEYDEVPDRKVWIGWQTPAGYAPGDAELDITANILCGGKDARLYDALVRTEQIARDVSCYQESRRLQSSFIVTATAAKGHTTDEVVARVQQLVAAYVADAPPTEEEVKAAVAGYEVSFYRGIETIQGKASILSTYLDAFDDPDRLAADLGRYLAATPSTVQATAKTWLTQPHVELHVLPLADRPAAP